jgi:hypothetical protein
LAGIGPARSQGVIVPANFYPTGGGTGDAWGRLISTTRWLQANGTGGYRNLIAVGNPASGPGAVRDPSYARAFRKLRAAGGKVIGYVSTRLPDAEQTGPPWKLRPWLEIKASIDNWVALYGDRIDGIFIDEFHGFEAGNIPNYSEPKTYLSLYQDVYWLVRTHHGLSIAVANPGISFAAGDANPDAAWVADAFILHENAYADSGSYTLPLWTSTPAHSSKAGVLIHAMPAGNERAAVRTVRSAKRKGVRWLYVTDDVLPNPWDTLPGQDFYGVGGGDPNPYWRRIYRAIGLAQ